jgi:hypothetical protein
MQILPGSESGPLMDHVLMCSDCQERLDAVIEVVKAMREAAVTIGKLRSHNGDGSRPVGGSAAAIHR